MDGVTEELARDEWRAANALFEAAVNDTSAQDMEENEKKLAGAAHWQLITDVDATLAQKINMYLESIELHQGSSNSRI